MNRILSTLALLSTLAACDVKGPQTPVAAETAGEPRDDVISVCLNVEVAKIFPGAKCYGDTTASPMMSAMCDVGLANKTAAVATKLENKMAELYGTFYGVGSSYVSRIQVVAMGFTPTDDQKAFYPPSMFVKDGSFDMVEGMGFSVEDTSRVSLDKSCIDTP